MSQLVHTIALDSGRMNLLTTPSVRALRDALRDASRDPATRALVLVGREDAFSAGLDMKTLGQGGAVAQELLVEMGELLIELYGGPLPVVAACRGHAVAAGAMLLLASDLRLGAAGGYRVGFSEVRSGLPLPALPVLLARDRLDPRRLQEATLLGRLFDPEEAVAIGFLDALVAPEALEAEAVSRAEALAALPEGSYAGSLDSVRGATLAKLREGVAHEHEKLAALRGDA